jgi:hypothetical protein
VDVLVLRRVGSFAFSRLGDVAKFARTRFMSCSIVGTCISLVLSQNTTSLHSPVEEIVILT